MGNGMMDYCEFGELSPLAQIAYLQAQEAKDDGRTFSRFGGSGVALAPLGWVMLRYTDIYAGVDDFQSTWDGIMSDLVNESDDAAHTLLCECRAEVAGGSLSPAERELWRDILDVVADQRCPWDWNDHLRAFDTPPYGQALARVEVIVDTLGGDDAEQIMDDVVGEIEDLDTVLSTYVHDSSVDW